MKTTNYLFAWSSYSNGYIQSTTPIYKAVREDLTIYTNTNWEEFYKVTGLFCEYSVKYALVGEMPDGKEIFTHKRYSNLFTIEANRITIVNEGDYIPYPSEGREPEEIVFSAMAGGTGE